MALTRSMLKGMGLTEEQVGAIIDEHVAAIDGLKTERDKYKAEAEELPAVQKELQELQTKVANSGNDEWQGKYEKEHADFEQYKAQITEKERESECKNLYKSLLTEVGIGDQYIGSILNVTDFKSLKITKDGKLGDAEKLVDNIKSAYSGFITSQSKQGAGTETPPAGSGTMTRESFSQLPLAEQMKYANEHPSEVNNLL